MASTTTYKVRSGFFLHRKEGKANKTYQGGELVELTDAEYAMRAHQVELPSEAAEPTEPTEPTPPTSKKIKEAIA